MRVVLKVLAGLVLLVVLAAAVMYGLGSRLPVQHMASAAITIDAPQGKVWSLMEDVGAEPRWRSQMVSVEMLPDENGHRCWAENANGMHVPLCEEVAAAPVTRVVAVADPKLAFGGTWTYTLTALTPETTSVSITENGTTEPAMWRFLGHYILGEDTMIRQYEKDLKAAAEKR